MLTLVQNNAAVVPNRLHLAIAHLESAILHINNDAQGIVPLQSWTHASDIEDLQLIVRALSDVVDALRSRERALEAACAGDGRDRQLHTAQQHT